MKNHGITFGGIVTLSLSIVLAIQLCSCSFAAETDENQMTAAPGTAYSLTEEAFPIYFGSMDNQDTIKLYFADENKEIPYLDADTVKDLLERFYRDVNGDEDYSLTLKKDGPEVTFLREDQSAMVFDADRDVIHFDNYDSFFKASWSYTVIDALEHYGTINCLQCDEDQSYSCSGAPVDIDLAKYGIDMIEADEECFIPMQTLSDIGLSVNCYVNLVYNRQAVFAIEYSMQDSFAFIEKIYDAPTGMRSRMLADFTYKEFCMLLDHFYGLREQHGIEEFDDYMGQTGIKERLLNENPEESLQAIYDLLDINLGDLHSGYLYPTYLAGIDHRVHANTVSQALYDNIIASGRINRAKYEILQGDPPGYEEIGNTAYITFSSFLTLEDGRDYYQDPPTADTNDTVGLCLYAFSQITREGSPIENVVLDLSGCSGGDSTTGSFVLAMFLGRPSVCVENTLTGAYANECFMADANLDGEYDDQVDTLTNYNLYCLTSPNSFSCANLVASVMKNSRLGTIIGQRSSGGSCILMPIALADGTLAQISGNRCYSTMINGSVHDIDEGVEPDIYIAKPASFADRTAFTEFINSTP